MECKFTCFDRVLHLVKPIKKKDMKEAHKIITEYSFQDLINFGLEKGCFTTAQASTLYEGIVMWEDLEGNYWEEDYDKYMALLDKMGIEEIK